MIRGVHSEVPEGFQGTFGGYYALSPGCPPGPILTKGFRPASVNTLYGRAPGYPRICLVSSSRRSAL